jgi:hypothetical protein
VTRRGFYIDEDAYWKDSTQPGDQLARVLDVAGHWVFIQIGSGPRKGQKAWVHCTELKHYDASLESPSLSQVQAKRDEICRLIQEARPGQAGVCQVCFGALYATQRQAENGHTFQPAPGWLYCPVCNRMQRNQLKAIPLAQGSPVPSKHTT